MLEIYIQSKAGLIINTMLIIIVFIMFVALESSSKNDNIKHINLQNKIKACNLLYVNDFNQSRLCLND